MTEKHKLQRQLAIRAAKNSNAVAYLDKKLNIRQSHNYLGSHLEKYVYSNGKVTIYDAKDKVIQEVDVTSKKAKNEKETKKEAKPAKETTTKAS